MLTRRDALKIAAAAAFAPAAPFAVSPAEAAALLDGPATFDPGAGRGKVEDADLLSPLGFAEALDGVDLEEWFEHGAPQEMATYKQSLNDLIDLYPEFRDPPYRHPITRMDEGALAMWSVAWMAGVRAGAAYEHLRLAMGAPRELCRRCHGQGRLWAGRPFRSYDDGTNETRCADCGGRGTTATPAPSRAALAVD